MTAVVSFLSQRLMEGVGGGVGGSDGGHHGNIVVEPKRLFQFFGLVTRLKANCFTAVTYPHLEPTFQFSLFWTPLKRMVLLGRPGLLPPAHYKAQFLAEGRRRGSTILTVTCGELGNSTAHLANAWKGGRWILEDDLDTDYKARYRGDLTPLKKIKFDHHSNLPYL